MRKEMVCSRERIMYYVNNGRRLKTPVMVRVYRVEAASLTGFCMGSYLAKDATLPIKAIAWGLETEFASLL